MSLACSKVLDPADLFLLDADLSTVDQHFASSSPQHPMRRWEYAMALHALDVWLGDHRADLPAGYCIDVGGAGSPFHLMLGPSALVIDPQENWTLADYLGTAPRLSQAVFCLSVLEHIPNLPQFLYHLACLTAPGGLLFLTVDCQEHEVPDQAHYHWLRERLFSPTSITHQVYFPLANLGFTLLGERDYAYHGNWVPLGYTAASLALVKRA